MRDRDKANTYEESKKHRVRSTRGYGANQFQKICQSHDNIVVLYILAGIGQFKRTDDDS